MRQRRDFQTHEEYAEYMLIYIASRNLSALLIQDGLIIDEPEEFNRAMEDMANIATASANALLKNLGIIKAQEEVEKPKSVKSKINVDLKKAELDSYIHMAESLFKDKKYNEALVSYEKALMMDFANKKILKGIEQCKKWIKAVSDLEVLEEEKTFVNETAKEEFTTNFPTLE